MIAGLVRLLKGGQAARGLAVALLLAADGLFVGSDAFWHASGPLSIPNFHSNNRKTGAFPDRWA